MKIFAFLKLVSALLLLTFQAGDTAGLTANNIHAKDFVEIGGRNYYIPPSDIRLFYDEALTFCKDIGMELVSLETEEEDFAILSYLYSIENIRSVHWTSGQKIDGKFIWTGSGELFNYTHWNYDQPDQPKEAELCVYIQYAEQWKAVICDGVCTFICEQQP